MPCTANTHPNHPTQSTVRPQAATEPTTAVGCPPTQSTASPSANFCATGAAESTTPAALNHSTTQAQALLAVVEAGLLADNLYYFLVNNRHPTREQIALCVGQAGQMHRHAREAIDRLVDLYMEMTVRS